MHFKSQRMLQVLYKILTGNWRNRAKQTNNKTQPENVFLREEQQRSYLLELFFSMHLYGGIVQVNYHGKGLLEMIGSHAIFDVKQSR